ncbi:sugar ABC transporter ATP-binding protein [Propionispora hippei]|nr:sugar ABC transporter ATP-binding protein [Propionispora hippei]
MDGISKTFGGIKAVSNMHLQLKRGEIHALIGENGAGKSTLMKILSGAYANDTGTIKIDGQIIKIGSPRMSLELGIAVIYQEFMLVPHLTVAENIFIDKLSDKSGLVNWNRLRAESKKLLVKLGFGDIDPDDRILDLSIAHQQIVEICKALSKNIKVLVLDEPSAVLTFSEIEKLFTLLRELKKQGIAIVYISHRLEELFALCDIITIMKDGCFAGTFNVHEINKTGLIEKMVGRELNTLFPKRKVSIGETMLEVKNLCAGRQVNNVSFCVKKGEIIGFSGLVGAGRTETMRVIFGADKKESGSINYKGKEVNFLSPYDAVKNKMGFLPEDRKQQGVLVALSIRLNTTLTSLAKVSSSGVLNHKKDTNFATKILSNLKAKYSSINDNVNSLSGGNQQKVALAKWLAADCELIILDEPTRGVDVGAKAEIYKAMNDLAEAGVSIIMISSEMEEVINMSDRVYVMRQGSISGELAKSELTEVEIMKLCVGE